MSKIVCKIDLFDLYQKVYLTSDTYSKVIGKYNTSELDESLIKLCKQYQTKEIFLFGDAMYLEVLARSIKNLDESKELNIIILGDKHYV